MCYWVGTKKVREEMLRLAGKDPDNEIAQLFYRSFSGDTASQFREWWVAIGKARPVLSLIIMDPQGQLVFRNMRWGIDWSYTDHKTGKQYSRELINSTCEKVFFVHRKSIYTQKCVIPLDGYYEFFHFAGQVYPHFIQPAEGLFLVAGVWEESVDMDTGELIQSFSILTTPPNELALKLHNNPKAPNGPRMLLILPYDKIGSYLRPGATQDELRSLFNPYPDQLMDAYPTTRFLKKEFAGKLNTEAVRERIDYPELFFA